MLLSTVYPIVWMILWGAFLIFLAILLLRLTFNYTDPNPFGKVGRFGFKVRKATEKWVYPAARFLATFRVDPRLAPILTILIGLILTYFASQVIYNTCFVIDGLSFSIAAGNVKALIGFILYALLSLLVLFILLRFIAQWFVFTRRTLLGFVMKVTDPIMLPVQRLIPPIGMFDISAMIVLVVISLLQSLVMNIFVRA